MIIIAKSSTKDLINRSQLCIVCILALIAIFAATAYAAES